MKRITFLFALTLMLGLVALNPAAAQSDEEAPVVRGVMFWSSTCPHCHYVLSEVLPPLQEQYGDQLQITLVELNTEENAQLFYLAGASAGLQPEELGVPMLIVGEYLMMGSAQIPEELPGLIERYLAEGGVDLPAIPGLDSIAATAPNATAPAAPIHESAAAESLAPAIENEAVAPPAAAEPEAAGQGISGSVPAFIVLAGMILALILAAIILGMARSGGIQTTAAGWVAWSIPVLAVVGLAVAGYLTYVETQTVAAICGPVGDCNTVQSSSYAKLFGVLPIGILGLVGYMAMLVAWFRGRSGSTTARTLLVGMAAFGVAFSVYLTYLELFVIEAVCLWCLSSAVIMTLILLAAAVWLAGAWATRTPRVTGRTAQA